jgi:hypothetical protein
MAVDPGEEGVEVVAGEGPLEREGNVRLIRQGRRMHSPRDQKPVHLQGIVIIRPDGTTPSQPHYFLEGRREAPALARHRRLSARFLPPPHRTVRAVLSHTALRRSSPSAFGYLPRQARWGLGATTVPARLVKPRRFGEAYVTIRQP